MAKINQHCVKCGGDSVSMEYFGNVREIMRRINKSNRPKNTPSKQHIAGVLGTIDIFNDYKNIEHKVKSELFEKVNDQIKEVEEKIKAAYAELDHYPVGFADFYALVRIASERKDIDTAICIAKSTLYMQYTLQISPVGEFRELIIQKCSECKDGIFGKVM